jgi:hypothetical protein
MIRDNGPINNIGFGVTSRDIGSGKNEEEGQSPNSGFISRALNGHPVLKMVTALVATGVAAELAGKFVRQGGLRLRRKAYSLGI